MKHLIIGTAGHVDHGKTALIKALTNIDCDTHREEKERGITINLGFAHLDLQSGESVGIVDVPGHKDFIKTMVAGAYGIDLVLLVVAADSGIMPQTEEHMQIVEMLGIKHAVVVLNKSDLVDDETIELAQLEVAEFLEGTPLESAPVVPVSAITGAGIQDLIEVISQKVGQIQPRPSGKRFRLYVDRLFNVTGLGFIVTGTVLEGEIQTGRELFLLPGKTRKVKIRNIERHGVLVTSVYAGDRAALNLAGLKQEDFERGMVLSSEVVGATVMTDAILSLFIKSPALKTWSNVLFYSGTFESTARIHLLDRDELSPGETGIVQIHLARQTILVNKDKYIVRNSSNTVTLGGGTIIDTKPLHHRKRTEKLICELTDLVEATLHSDKLINLVKIELKKANAPVFVSNLAVKLHKTVDEIVSSCREEDQSHVKYFEPDENTDIILISGERDLYYHQSVISALETWHLSNPILEEGLEKDDFIGKFGFAKNEAGRQYLNILLQRMLSESAIKRSGRGFALASHEVKMDSKTEAQLEWLEKAIRSVGKEKPVLAEIEVLAHEQKINKDRLKMLLKYLGQQCKLIFYEGEFIHYTIVDNSRKLLLEKIASKEDGINEKEFREMISGTRKLVQMLLGIFIQEGIIEKPTFYILITEKGRLVRGKS